MAGERATEDEVEAIRAQMGLHDPIEEQYFRYLAGLAQGDLGRSLAFRGMVLDEIIKRIPATLELALASTIISAILGVLTGLVSAIKRNSFFDYFSMIFAVGGICIPNFWLGLMFQLYLGVYLGDWYASSQFAQGFLYPIFGDLLPLPISGRIGVEMAPDRVTGQPQVMFHADFGGILDLFRRTAQHFR